MNYTYLSSKDKPRVDRHFPSFEDMIAAIRKELTLLKLTSSQENEPSQETTYRKYRISPTDIATSILLSCDVAVQTSANNADNIVYVYDPESKLMIPHASFFEKIITAISSIIDFSGSNYRIVFEVEDISKITRLVMRRLMRSRQVREIVEAPKHYVVTLNDVVIDLNTKQDTTLDDFKMTYDALSKNFINHLNIDSLEKSKRDEITLYRQIIERVMNDWSGESSDIEYLMWQIIYAVLQNDNHGKFFIIKGNGGNGKSSFMDVLSKIAGFDNTHYANINQFGDPNSINHISMSTRVVIGDDAATNHKLSDVALSNLKSLVTGNPISLPMKYSQNVTVRTNAIFIQGTNTDVSVSENNSALKSRLVLINWTDIDFRSKRREMTFNLDDLLKTQLFVDVWAQMCLEKIDYFKEFAIPANVKESTLSMIESNDSVKLFLEDVYSLVDGFEEVPVKALFVKFEQWMKDNNPSGGMMKMQTFTKSLSRLSNEFGFKIGDRNSRRKCKKRVVSCAIASLEIKDFPADKQIFIEPSQPLTSSEISEFLSLDVVEDDLTDRQRQIVIRQAIENNDSSLVSKYSSIFM